MNIDYKEDTFTKFLEFAVVLAEFATADSRAEPANPIEQSRSMEFAESSPRDFLVRDFDQQHKSNDCGGNSLETKLVALNVLGRD